MTFLPKRRKPARSGILRAPRRAWPKHERWVRGHACIAPGDVDERSIVEVRADDLAGYGQCHLFAGIIQVQYRLVHSACGQGGRGTLDKAPIPSRAIYNFSTIAMRRTAVYPVCGLHQEREFPRRTRMFVGRRDWFDRSERDYYQGAASSWCDFYKSLPVAACVHEKCGRILLGSRGGRRRNKAIYFPRRGQSEKSCRIRDKRVRIPAPSDRFFYAIVPCTGPNSTGDEYGSREGRCHIQCIEGRNPYRYYFTSYD